MNSLVTWLDIVLCSKGKSSNKKKKTKKKKVEESIQPLYMQQE